MKKLTPKDRIKIIYEELGMSRRKFAESVGMAPTGMSGIFSAGAKVSQVLANSIQLIHGYRADWILTGKGPKYVSNSANSNEIFADVIIFNFYALDPDRRVQYLEEGILKALKDELIGSSDIYLESTVTGPPAKDNPEFVEYAFRIVEMDLDWQRLEEFLEKVKDKNLNLYRDLLMEIYYRFLDNNNDLEWISSLLDVFETEKKGDVGKKADKAIKLVDEMLSLWFLYSPNDKEWILPDKPIPQKGLNIPEEKKKPASKSSKILFSKSEGRSK